jgi:hypothetical protein
LYGDCFGQSEDESVKLLDELFGKDWNNPKLDIFKIPDLECFIIPGI